VLFRSFPDVLPGKVLALALLVRVVRVLWSLPGLVVAVTGPKVPKVAAMEAELGLEDAPNQPAAKA
jgi:hypothetical protein